jgi:hypothetical protein
MFFFVAQLERFFLLCSATDNHFLGLSYRENGPSVESSNMIAIHVRLLCIAPHHQYLNE